MSSYASRAGYNVERLIAKHGSDRKLPDLRAILAKMFESAIVLGL